MTIFKHVIWSTNRTDQYREMWELWTLGQFSLPLVFLLTHTPYWIVYFSVLTNSWLFYSIYSSTNINSFEKKRWLPKLPQWQKMFPHFTLHWNENVISWWHHQMETFSALLALCEGNHRPLGDSLAKVSDAELWFFLWSAPEQTIEQTIEMLLSRHRAHYDITVMLVEFSSVAALEVVILTTSSAACDENFISSNGDISVSVYIETEASGNYARTDHNWAKMKPISPQISTDPDHTLFLLFWQPFGDVIMPLV